MGQYILVCIYSSGGTLYLSTNYGSSFSTVSISTNKQFFDCAISGTGQYMAVTIMAGFLYRSGDYGVSWQQVTNISSGQAWGSVTLSQDGKYCLISGSGSLTSVYISSNFDTSAPTFISKAILSPVDNVFPNYNAVSSNGQYMIQLTWGNTSGISISSNYGSSFTNLSISTIGITGASNNNFYSIVMTPDTNNVYLACYLNGLYKSTNLFSGSPTFTKITSATFTEQTWNTVGVSLDGSYVVASTDAKTYYSTNSGSTWLVGYTGKITYLAMSGDARYIVATNNNISSQFMMSSI